ncbi:hypothetical protein V1478_008445, partial [Vespula squamosa]
MLPERAEKHAWNVLEVFDQDEAQGRGIHARGKLAFGHFFSLFISFFFCFFF